MPAISKLIGRVRARRTHECDERIGYDLFPRRSRLLSLESFMSFGMGSDCSGGILSTLACANQSSVMSLYKSCPRSGSFACSKCRLVKYCSERCQKQHWIRHRKTCLHRLLSSSWKPAWILDDRRPVFLSSQQDCFRDIWNSSPALDCLQLEFNEGADATMIDLKLCFAASGDIGSLVATVNGLPRDYGGRCSILLNDLDAVIVNRNLVILFALLRSGPSVEEAAELATHLMYSAAIPAASASYLDQCIDIIYGSCPNGDMSFRRSLETRGDGKIYSAQTAMGIREPLDMFHTSHSLANALESMRLSLCQPSSMDSRDRFFSKLKPAHRLAFQQFRDTGILAPFSLSTRTFTHPNKLMFASNGTWLSSPDANPLRGWDVEEVQKSGVRLGSDPADIFGCLFFHVKTQLAKFARRIRDFNIDIHLTQFDAHIISKGISAGVLPTFHGACFDRVDTSNLMDHIGLQGCMDDWASLLNRSNPHSVLLAHSRLWNNSASRQTDIFMKQHHQRPSDIESYYCEAPINDSLSVHDPRGLRLRQKHRIHPKRFGLSLNDPKQRLPELTSNEYYDLFTIGGAELPVRFLEFQL